MHSAAECFNGTWCFSLPLSQLSTPAPPAWIQEIAVVGETISVCERIARADGTETIQRIQARIDGADYPVAGSPLVDTIAYTRINLNTISGIGKKNRAVCLRETVQADPERRTLTLTYDILIGARIVAHGVAVFQPENIVNS
jgi:hypothetical protein